jgi:hypothetical protein
MRHVGEVDAGEKMILAENEWVFIERCSYMVIISFSL